MLYFDGLISFFDFQHFHPPYQDFEDSSKRTNNDLFNCYLNIL